MLKSGKDSKQDIGTVELFGRPPSDISVRARIGYMPEEAYFPDDLTGLELVKQHALLSGLNRGQAVKRSAGILERVGMSHAAPVVGWPAFTRLANNMPARAANIPAMA